MIRMPRLRRHGVDEARRLDAAAAFMPRLASIPLPERVRDVPRPRGELSAAAVLAALVAVTALTIHDSAPAARTLLPPHRAASGAALTQRPATTPRAAAPDPSVHGTATDPSAPF